jgi:hypothetical protein
MKRVYPNARQPMAINPKTRCLIRVSASSCSVSLKKWSGVIIGRFSSEVPVTLSSIHCVEKKAELKRIITATRRKGFLIVRMIDAENSPLRTVRRKKRNHEPAIKWVSISIDKGPTVANRKNTASANMRISTGDIIFQNFVP